MKYLKKFQVVEAVLAIFALVIANISLMPIASAAALTGTSVLEMGGTSNASPMIVGDGQQVAFEFKPATTVSGGYAITLTFGYGGTLWNQTTTPTSTSGVVAASGQTVAAGGCATLFPGTPTFLPGTLTPASSQAAGTITITSSGTGDTITAGTEYCAVLTNVAAVTNPTGSAVYPVEISTPSDSQTTGIDVLPNSGTSDYYSITGTIAPTFTLGLSGNTDTFPSNLSTTLDVSSGITTTIVTNAASGWFVWAEDSQGGLHSATTGTSILSVSTASNHTFTGSTDQYGLGVSADNTTNYAYGGGTTGGGLSNSTFNEIATSGAPTSSTTFVTHELAIAAATDAPANNYTDTITEIGAGSF